MRIDKSNKKGKNKKIQILDKKEKLEDSKITRYKNI
jgi:hypothetical protein